jgi:hypothetical protein
MRAAAETVQATFLLRELIMETSGLFIEFSYFFRFAFLAFNKSGQNHGCNLQHFHALGGKAKAITPHGPLIRQAAFLIFLKS